MGVESCGVNNQGLFRWLQEPPESSGLVYAEGFQVGKVGCAGFAHCVAILTTGCDSLLGSHTMQSARAVKVLQSLVAGTVVPGTHDFVETVGVDRVDRGTAMGLQARALQGEAQG